MWGTPHAPLSQQRFSFFVTAPYNAMRFSVTAFSLLLALTIVFVGCDTTGVTPIESEIPEYSDESALAGLRSDDSSPAFQVEGMSERDRVYIRWGTAGYAQLEKVAIYRINDDKATYLKTVDGGTSDIEETGLSAGIYEYAFRSYYADNSLNGTNWVTVSVEPNENLPNAPVGNLSASGSGSQITLEWDLPTDGNLTDVTVTQYSQSSGESPNKTVSVGADATSFVDNGLAADTYYYEVETVFEESSRNGRATVTVTLN